MLRVTFCRITLNKLLVHLFSPLPSCMLDTLLSKNMSMPPLKEPPSCAGWLNETISPACHWWIWYSQDSWVCLGPTQRENQWKSIWPRELAYFTRLWPLEAQPSPQTLGQELVEKLVKMAAMQINTSKVVVGKRPWISTTNRQRTMRISTTWNRALRSTLTHLFLLRWIWNMHGWSFLGNVTHLDGPEKIGFLGLPFSDQRRRGLRAVRSFDVLRLQGRCKWR